MRLTVLLGLLWNMDYNDFLKIIACLCSSCKLTDTSLLTIHLKCRAYYFVVVFCYTVLILPYSLENSVSIKGFPLSAPFSITVTLDWIIKNYVLVITDSFSPFSEWINIVLKKIMLLACDTGKACWPSFYGELYRHTFHTKYSKFFSSHMSKRVRLLFPPPHSFSRVEIFFAKVSV